jgi:hypothetical protein
MTYQRVDDPADAMNLAAHMAQVALPVIEAAIRVAAARRESAATALEQADPDARTHQDLQLSRDRISWTHAADPSFLVHASTQELATSWAAAATWCDRDADAELCLQPIESELRYRHREAMTAFDDLREQGVGRGEAMRQVAHLFTGTGDGAGSPPWTPPPPLHSAPWVAPEPARTPEQVAADGFPQPASVGLGTTPTPPSSLPVGRPVLTATLGDAPSR